MNDPYVLPNGTLKNKLGITKQSELEAFEGRSVAARLAALNLSVERGPFDFKYLCDVHKSLFQDIYAWAGKPRTINISKRDYDDQNGQVIAFTPSRDIEQVAQRIFKGLPSSDDLSKSSPDDFAKVISDFLVDINNLHPFREGNGRTQRHLIRSIGRAAGLDIAWDVVTRERMTSVSVMGAKGDYEPMYRLLREIMDPDRVRALRKALDFLKSSNAVPWNDLYIATTVAGQTYHGILVGRATPDFMLRAKRKIQDWIVIGSTSDLEDGQKSGDEIEILSRKW